MTSYPVVPTEMRNKAEIECYRKLHGWNSVILCLVGNFGLTRKHFNVLNFNWFFRPILTLFDSNFSLQNILKSTVNLTFVLKLLLMKNNTRLCM